MSGRQDRVFSSAQPAFRPAQWFADCHTPAGPARFWRLIPAEAFATVKLFARVRLEIATLGDVPIANEDQRRELSRFLGRSIVHVDRCVHVYQGKSGAATIADWLDEDILRLARQAAEFNGFR